MENNLKVASIILGTVILGLIYSGNNPVYAHPSDNWVNTNFPYTPNYVDTTLKIACNSTTTPDPGGDRDGDGICDHWEDGTYGAGLHIRFNVAGVAYSYDKGCDPICPSPVHKDVYLELDWMTGHDPDPNVIPDVTAAFSNSPTLDPGDTVHPTGINLHIQPGETSTSGDVQVHQSLLKVSSALTNSNPGFWVLKQNRFGTIAERNTGDPNHNTYCVTGTTAEPSHDCLTAKRQVFHYMIFIHQQSEIQYQTSSGWSEINGNDAVVSLGSFTNQVGSIDNQEATLMHELGHNLALYHGGGTPPDLNHPEYDNCKPNYLSIMSYTYQFRTTNDVCRPLDYSRINLQPVLIESGLTDSLLGSYKYPNPDPDPPGYSTGTCNNAAHNNQERPIYYENPSGGTSTGHTASTGDWNLATSPTSYSQDINDINLCTGTSVQTTLTSHDDWNGAGMNFVMINSAKFSSGNNTNTGERSSGTSSECNNEVIGGLEIPEGLKTFSNKTLDIIASYGGSIWRQDSGTEILMPSIFDPTGNLTSMANEIGGKFVPSKYPVTAAEIQHIKLIPVLKIAAGQGDPDESACPSQDEITSIQVKKIHNNQLKAVNQAITTLPDSVFKDSKSSGILQGYIEKAILDNNEGSPWGVVSDLNLIKVATDGMSGGNPSDDMIIDKEDQAKIYSIVQENMDRFIVEGTVTNMTKALPAPTLDAQRKDNEMSAVLTWKETSQYFGPLVEGYKIERNYNDGTFVTVEQNTHSDSTIYTDSNLQLGTYSYKVTAINTFGEEGDVSNVSTKVLINSSEIHPDLLAYIILIIIIAILIIIMLATIRR